MEFTIQSWEKADLDKNILILNNYALNYAKEKKKYYEKGSPIKRAWAKALRAIAIVSAALGGLLPVLSQLFTNDKFRLEPAWATVAITIAVTSIGLDRFFGFSSAWMRFVSAQLKIDSKIEQFKFSLENERFLLQGAELTPDKTKSIIAIIGSFINEISQIVQDETNTWMTEFQNVIQKFNEEMNAKLDNSKFGGIYISVQNADKFPSGIKFQLEGKDAIAINGSSYSFNSLYPKIYKLAVSGRLIEENNGVRVERDISNEILINVTPGNITTSTITLT
jgi:hypothetical protein